MQNKDFLNWIADRLVNVYGESQNVDFVLNLRSLAKEQDQDARCQYLETLNNNQEASIKTLYAENDELKKKLDGVMNFLDTLVDECEGSLLWYQYRWVTQRINKFLTETIDE